jgi:hypothetical protein
MNPTLIDDEVDDEHKERCGGHQMVGTFKYNSYEQILSSCHTATTLDEQKRYFQDLVTFLEGPKWPTSSSVSDNNVDEDNQTSSSRMMNVIAQEAIARRILTEWPYRQLSGPIDQILDACGVIGSVSICSTLLKEIAATTTTPRTTNTLSEEDWTTSSVLPLRSIVHACWTTVQRMLLQATQRNEDGYHHSNNNDDDDVDDPEACDSLRRGMLNRDDGEQFHNGYQDDNIWKHFIEGVVMLLPQTVANAYHAVRLQVPINSTSSHFFSRLVYAAASWTCIQEKTVHTKSPGSFQYTKTIIQTLLQKRRAEYVARGLVHIPGGTTKAYFLLDTTFLVEMQLTPSGMANLILALLQHLDMHTPPQITKRNQQSHVQQNSVIQSCNFLCTSSSIEHQECIVESLVLSKASSSVLASGMERRWSTWIVQVLLSPEATSDQLKSFLYHLSNIAERWSQWTFVQEVDGRQQHHVSLVLWQGLAAITASTSLQETDNGELVINLVQGVSHRLESSLPTIRQDGMRIAQKMADGLGQTIQFDELDEDNDDPVNIIGNMKENNAVQGDDLLGKSSGVLEGVELPATSRNDNAMNSSRNATNRFMNPDIEYDSDAEGESSHVPEGEGASEDGSKRDTYDDGSVQWDEDLIPYDLQDDEDDLLETPRPLHLLEALDLLRTGESHENAYSRHEAALNALTELIRSRPDNLPDISVSLALELVRMENKFNMDGFTSNRDSALRALLVQEPVSVGQALIKEIFEDHGLSNRLNILAALQGSAFELSGNHTDASVATARLSGSKEGIASYVGGAANDSSEQISRVLSNTRRKRSTKSVKRIIKNHFASVAPGWFYSLISGFLKNKENEALWTGSTGSLLLAHFLRCLALIVEFSGFLSSQVLATDLLSLVWEFRSADVAEVRLGVLISVATAISVLPEEEIFSLLLANDASLPKTLRDMSQVDPDRECRSLSQTISRSIHSVLSNSL